MDIVKKIAAELEIRPQQVEAVIKLIDEGNTIPFIARYRKEAHGSLNDEQLRNLSERLTYLRTLEEKKEQDRQALRDLHTEYSSIDRMVDKQNQFLRTILKYKSCAELNAELVQNLIEKIYVYRGKRVEIIWKWNDEFAKVMGGTDDEK